MRIKRIIGIISFFLLLLCAANVTVKGASILKYQLDLNPDNLNFIFITDLHYGHGENLDKAMDRQLDEVENIAKYNDLDFIVIGGDIYNGNVRKSKEYIFDNLDRLSKRFRMLGMPVLFIMGNHDDNSDRHYTDEQMWSFYRRNPDYVLTKEEFYEHTIAYYAEDLGGIQDNYYYYDLEEKNTRVVCLNCADYPYEVVNGKLKYIGMKDMGYSDQQMNWLLDDALTEPDKNYIFISHDFNASLDYRKENNKENLFNIIRTLSTKSQATIMNRSVDFTMYTSNVVGYFCGHLHADNLYYSALIEAHVMNVGSAYPDPDSLRKSLLKKGYVRYTDRLKEMDKTSFLFDVVTVSDQMVTTIRIGEGENRSFSYIKKML